jgi:hypothetical protein
MKTILIVQSKFLLKLFRQRKEGASLRNGYYLLFSKALGGAADQLRNLNFSALPNRALSRDLQEAVLNDYIEVIGKMAQWNGHDLHWWATHIASKNRFASPLPALLDVLIRCLNAIEEITENGRPLIILGAPWPVVRALEHSANRLNWSLHIISWPWSRLLKRFLGQAKAWGSLTKELLTSIFQILEVRRYFGQIKQKAQEKKPVYLIKSFVYPNAFSEKDLYRDPFFGNLPLFLSQHLDKISDILTVTVGFEKRSDCYKRMRELKDKHVVPLLILLHWWDAMMGFVQILRCRIYNTFRVAEKVTLMEFDISGLLRELLASGGWRISLFQYLHFKAASRIAKYYNILACVMTYEGNPWERMFIKGLQNVKPEIFIIGYQHAVIPQSAANMFLSTKELDHIPSPSLLLTTGNVPVNILNKYSTFKKGFIQAACALRFDYLFKYEHLPRRKPQDFLSILVVLEGVRDVLSLVEYVFDYASRLLNVRFRIRAHPVLPFEKLLEYLGKNVRQVNCDISRGVTVLEDIANCDVVLYWGTTVALEALMMGRPVIHFDRGDVLSYDPLFDLEIFKWKVTAQDDLSHVIDSIRGISDHEYYKLQKSARQYIMNYFHPVSDTALSQFLPKEVFYRDSKE